MSNIIYVSAVEDAITNRIYSGYIMIIGIGSSYSLYYSIFDNATQFFIKFDLNLEKKIRDIIGQYLLQFIKNNADTIKEDNFKKIYIFNNEGITKILEEVKNKIKELS